MLCLYCNEPAGFLRKKHKACHEKWLSGKDDIVSIVVKISSDKSLPSATQNITEICNKSFITSTQKKEIIVGCLEQLIDKALDDNFLSQEEEYTILEIGNHFSIESNDLNINGYHNKLVKASILRSIMEGNIPTDKINIDIRELPFNFQKNEQIIWLEPYAELFEQKKRVQYVGGSQGVSIKIAKGVYYRTSASRGERVETEIMQHIDTGLLCVTNKHIYFSGEVKGNRIAFNKIIAFTPYSDGIGIQKDGANAKTQAFVTGDGWFLHNLLSNISLLD